eukprot:TRINITY_DN6702_c0_g2_i2.p1 TRINITY_DN6702_c0_g2~~TRINITY_DN6702_c0_g2_i2.p1  ORF type:complete len:311 (+),score=27.64 TRINITY_DN6702_c0_g2_i2:41-973(+)
MAESIMAGSRVKIQCPTCGYKSFPQWMNDQAHCLKCDAVVRTRPSCHQTVAESVQGARRAPGEVSTYKQPPGSAMESASGCCQQVAEGKIAKTAGTMLDPGASEGCRAGGKCMFKFARCSKCGRAEGVLQEPARKSPAAALAAMQSDQPKSAGRGPERFFYDKNSYTGTHAQGGPDRVAKGSGSIPDQCWKRPSPDNELARVTLLSQQARLGGNTSPSYSKRPSTPTLTTGTVALTSARPASRGRYAEAQLRPSSRGIATMRPRSAGGVTGPERFFYDKSTYTGTHMRGGPSSVDKGAGTSFDQSWKRPC